LRSMPSRYYFFVSVSPGAGTSKSFERSRACRSGLQDSIAPAFTAPIAFHFGAELVERHGAEHRDPLAEHPERHPQSALAALASDPRVTLELGDGAGVCHAALKRGTAGSATHMPAGSCGFLKSTPGLVALMVVADGGAISRCPGPGIEIPVYKKGSFTPVALSGLADCGRMTCATYRRGQI
jgi:hypothetical protein